jgi:hypothetical protein
MHSPSHHVEVALYADVTVIIAAPLKPTLLVRYLESYLNDLQPSTTFNGGCVNGELSSIS